MNETSELRAVRVWDLPTRLFHWLLALCVIGLIVTSKVGGSAIQWHTWLGLAAGALLIFRLLWGIVGGRWSRFGSFVYGPGAVLRYLRNDHRDGDYFGVGHNPLGALSVFAMIGVLVIQVATGLVADDEIATTGPLNRFVATEIGLAATGWHKGWGQWLIIGLVGLHVGAILVYRLRGIGLVSAMWRGDKLLPAAVPSSADSLRERVLALVLIGLCALGAVAVGRLGG